MNARPGHILILEDDADIRTFLEQALTGEGYSVCGVTSTSAALAALHARRPNLVIADGQIPGEPPFAFVHYLRANCDMAMLPVLLCTGGVDEARAVIQQAPEAPFTLLLKPFEITDLFAAVADLLPPVALTRSGSEAQTAIS